jgi:hypothetical protein
MTRMTREFSLVLLGATVLTAGYLAWDEEKAIARNAENNGRKRVGGGTSGHTLIWVHSSGGRSVSGGKPATLAGVSRGGFGSIGGRVGGFGG